MTSKKGVAYTLQGDVLIVSCRWYACYLSMLQSGGVYAGRATAFEMCRELVTISVQGEGVISAFIIRSIALSDSFPLPPRIPQT